MPVEPYRPGSPSPLDPRESRTHQQRLRDHARNLHHFRPHKDRVDRVCVRCGLTEVELDAANTNTELAVFLSCGNVRVKPPQPGGDEPVTGTPDGVNVRVSLDATQLEEHLTRLRQAAIRGGVQEIHDFDRATMKCVNCGVSEQTVIRSHQSVVDAMRCAGPPPQQGKPAPPTVPDIPPPDQPRVRRID